MRLGELVGIMAADVARLSVDQRQDGKLDEVGSAEVPGEHLRLVRMHHILRVVEHDGVRRLGTGRLIGDQRAPQSVEAIRLGRGPGEGADDDPQPRIVDRPGRGGGRAVVRIAAEVEPDVAIPIGGQRRPDHRRNDRRLVPRGHEQDQPWINLVAGLRLRIAGRSPRTAGQAEKKPQQIDGKIADAEDEKARRREQRRLAHQSSNAAPRQPDHVHSIRPRNGPKYHPFC